LWLARSNPCNRAGAPQSRRSHDILEGEFALIQGESPRIRHYKNSSGFRVGGSVILTNVKTP
jgi:hypothetical protein